MYRHAYEAEGCYHQHGLRGCHVTWGSAVKSNGFRTGRDAEFRLAEAR